MAALPPPSQVAGAQAPTYEAYFKQADTKKSGIIGALDAANFLKKSGLQQQILSDIWDLSDPGGKGYLDKQGFFVALKLIALAQSGLDVTLANLATQSLSPNLIHDARTLVEARLEKKKKRRERKQHDFTSPYKDLFRALT